MATKSRKPAPKKANKVVAKRTTRRSRSTGQSTNYGVAVIVLILAIALGLWYMSQHPFVIFTAGPAAQPPVQQPAAVQQPAQQQPAAVQQPAATGFCAATPVNPQDDVTVSLDNGNFVIEEFDNRVSPAVHKFWAYNVADQGQRNVWAIASWGMRAWACPDYTSAYETAMKSAVGYKAQHADHAFGPDAVEVK